MQDYRTSLDFQRRIIAQRRRERELQNQKKEEEMQQLGGDRQETLVAEEQTEVEEVDLDDEYIEEEDGEIENARRPRRMSATERFGITILLGLFGLVGLLALDVSGVPVVRLAKRTVYRMLRPSSPLSSDPFKAHSEMDSGGFEDNVVVIPRGE